MKNSEYMKMINRMTAHSCKLHTTMALAVIQIFKKEKQNNDFLNSEYNDANQSALIKTTNNMS